MGGLHILMVVLAGVFFSSQEWISGSEVTVTPGENITLYCDCKLVTGVYIVWYRQCSHENQPSLVLRIGHHTSPVHEDKHFGYKRLPRLEVVRNFSSDTYDLLISNITHSEEGFYYCGTEESLVEDKEKIEQKLIYTYGNVTRIVLDTGSEVLQPNTGPPNCGVCWVLLFSLCSVVGALLSSLLVCHLCRNKGDDCNKFRGDQKIPHTANHTRPNEDEDLSPAALHLHQRKVSQSLDSSIYSTVSYSRL